LKTNNVSNLIKEGKIVEATKIPIRIRLESIVKPSNSEDDSDKKSENKKKSIINSVFRV